MLGVYNIDGYSRGRILFKGLKANNVNVKNYLPTGILKYPKLLFRILKKDYDVLLVTGKLVLLTSWLLKWWHRKPIVFDVFISDYDTLVIDRKLVKPNSMKAKLLWWGDKLSCKISNYLIHDTKQHIEYFGKEFGSKTKKFKEILIGADDVIFKKLPSKKHDNFVVMFHGTFIPLQGIEYILEAAKILEKNKDISFEIIGAGQTFEEMKEFAKSLEVNNVFFRGMKPITDLPKLLATCDVALGIFGNTPKTQRVIPNKAYEIIACEIPLITADTPASRAFFTHKKDAVLVPAANSKKLADAITFLYKNKKVSLKIAENGLKLFNQKASVLAIGKSLKLFISEVK
jgi:glycosyltransferase involved in cell wall biosynthesis